MRFNANGIASNSYAGDVIQIFKQTRHSVPVVYPNGPNLYDNDIVPAVRLGTNAPAITPLYVGQLFVDTTHKQAFIAAGTGSGDWVQIG
jgi:hypothetical protein